MVARVNRALAIVCALLSGCGCLSPPPDDVGGLTAGDFEQISLNGFEPSDQEVDHNDYAWSMVYFQPDGGSGFVYVGTGNNITGMSERAAGATARGAAVTDLPARPPEIRRYRGEVFPNAWERVFDYRDVETDPDFETYGFRAMGTYQARSDGVGYLYAGTMGVDASVWRSASGTAGTWERVWTMGRPGSVRSLVVHDGTLYMALSKEGGDPEGPGEIWATDGNSFWPVIADGFGDPNNIGVMNLISYNGWLFAGTWNQAAGYEVWKLAGPDSGDGPVRVVAGGGPHPSNEAAITSCVFGGKLYIGNLIDPTANVLGGAKGADIIRIDEDDQWETVVGRDSLSGYGPGFDNRANAYIWSMAVHDGWLYAGTFDHGSAVLHGILNFGQVIKGFLQGGDGGNLAEGVFHMGADLYKTQDGIDWYPVARNGLGDLGNYGFRTMLSVDGGLYLGTANPFDGLEIWRGMSR